MPLVTLRVDPETKARMDRLEAVNWSEILRVRIPSLLPFEVLNALKYNPNFPSRGLLAASRALDAAGLLTVPLFGEYAERTVAIASRFDLTIYDAAYVALADIADCTLYTA